ncbi:hypothetical protein C8C77_10562 [Halanaerobium saccharolyticum]|uniref:Uncharacterized protein n=1 Tax=Halanaerobium saccharolyticum TaxID=43595 RepID=A0A4R7Z703_9FIRM|nr:hypothetical protein [Halanaerobium saccharolyticum]RAK12500.1 hypothetical protein C7958_10162 [Halanaerobium saccharolyticum]TDW06426.1 hypothetical protein C8C77_10562 [Halanaerobium saccharolyticum]TDX61674.1 hypothetical protein C7956_10562 [Halanaerobium saccharolyticum]
MKNLIKLKNIMIISLVIICALTITIFITEAAGDSAEIDLRIELEKADPERALLADLRVMLIEPGAPIGKRIIKSKKKKTRSIWNVVELEFSELELAKIDDYQLIVFQERDDLFWHISGPLNYNLIKDYDSLEMTLNYLPSRTLSFKGEQEIKFRDLDQIVHLTVAGNEYILFKEKTEAGIEYLNPQVKAQIKGREIIVEKGDQTFKSKLIGLNEVDFSKHKVIGGYKMFDWGGWRLDITDKNLKLKFGKVTPYTIYSPTLLAPISDFKEVINDDYILYEYDDSGYDADLKVKIVEKIYRKPDSFKTYPFTMYMDYNNSKYEGGAYLDKN